MTTTTDNLKRAWELIGEHMHPTTQVIGDPEGLAHDLALAFDAIAAGTQTASTPVASVLEMKKTDGADYYVAITLNGRRITPHKYPIRGRAEFDVEEWNHVLLGTPRPNMRAWLTRTGPDGVVNDAAIENICVAQGMRQWEASLSRPDLTERERVLGALQAYDRQNYTLRWIIPHVEWTKSEIETASNSVVTIQENGKNDFFAWAQSAGDAGTLATAWGRDHTTVLQNLADDLHLIKPDNRIGELP